MVARTVRVTRQNSRANMKICITDATFKHSQALSRHLRLYDPSLEIVGATPSAPRFPTLFSRHFTRLAIGSLVDVIAREKPQLIIPVGNKSVEIVSAMKTPLAILPHPDSIAIAIDKTRTLLLAEELGIPTPKTLFLNSIADADLEKIQFPCVVKGVLEAGKNMVAYPKDKRELMQAIAAIQNDPTQHGHFPAIQEYVSGVGLGFFGFYQNGELKRFYMHQRIREFPITGGASTAAQTIFHKEAFEYGKKILDKLQWNGVAMVEFKYTPETGRLALMEINPKFWGSTELGLAAGVNFGELLVRAIKGENIPAELSEDSYCKMKFLWPYDGDLFALMQSGNWKGFLDYLKGGYQSNTKANGFRLNMMRLAQTLRNKGGF